MYMVAVLCVAVCGTEVEGCGQWRATVCTGTDALGSSAASSGRSAARWRSFLCVGTESTSAISARSMPPTPEGEWSDARDAQRALSALRALAS